MIKKTALIVVATAAALFMAGCASQGTAQPASSGTATSGCKGIGSCKHVANSCKGKSSCKSTQCN